MVNFPVEPSEKDFIQPHTSGTCRRMLAGLDRWRRRRVTIRIAVTLEFTEGHRTVSLPAHTVWVSDEETLLMAERELPPGLHVELKQAFTGERQSGQLSQSPLKRGDGFYIGLRFDSLVLGFWHIVFPPLSL